MKIKLKTGLILFGLVFNSWAGPNCIKDKNPCDPNLLCTFKAEWHSKALLYVIHAANDPSRIGKRSKDGITYDGTYYNSSMAEAKAALPNGTKSEINQKAAEIFQEKTKKLVPSLFEMPECELGGKLDDIHRVKDGYEGMYTDEKCKIHVSYDSGDYEPGSFGSSDNVCNEFYTRDFAHEQIHRSACKSTKTPAEIAKRHEIKSLINEELQAYKHSMKLNEAYYKLLMAQCSDKFPNQEKVRAQTKNINKLLKGFDSRISP